MTATKPLEMPLPFVLKQEKEESISEDDSDDDIDETDSDSVSSLQQPSILDKNSLNNFDPSDEFLRLTSMVRRVYFSYLHKSIINNYNVCCKSRELSRNDLKKFASQMELHAVRASLESSLYRQSMLKMISDVKSSTTRHRIHKKLSIFLELPSTTVDAAVQTCDDIISEKKVFPVEKKSSLLDYTEKSISSLLDSTSSPENSIFSGKEEVQTLKDRISAIVHVSATEIPQEDQDPVKKSLTPSEKGPKIKAEPGGTAKSNFEKTREKLDLNKNAEAKKNTVFSNKNADLNKNTDLIENADLKENTDFSKKNADSSNKNADNSKKNADSSNKNADFSKKNADFSKKNADFSKKNADFSNKNPDFSDKNADLIKNMDLYDNADLNKNAGNSNGPMGIDSNSNIQNEDDNNTQDSLMQHLEEHLEGMFCESDDSTDLTSLIEKCSDIKPNIDKEIMNICQETAANVPNASLKKENGPKVVIIPKIPDSASFTPLSQESTTSKRKLSFTNYKNKKKRALEGGFSGEEAHEDKQSKKLKGIWFVERIHQVSKLRAKMLELSVRNYRKHGRIRSRFSELFGDDDGEDLQAESPIHIEEHLTACKERIAPWVVKYLMPFYSKKIIADRILFKAVAKHLTDMLIFDNTFPEEEYVNQYIKDYFRNKSSIKSQADIYI